MGKPPKNDPAAAATRFEWTKLMLNSRRGVRYIEVPYCTWCGGLMQDTDAHALTDCRR